MVKRLDIHVDQTIVWVVTVDKEICTERPLASFLLESLDGENSVTINDALVGNILTGEHEVPPSCRDLTSCPHLTDIVFREVEGNFEVILAFSTGAHSLPAPILQTQRP